MLANITAYALARHLRPTPVYDVLLEQDGVHLSRRQVPSLPRAGADAGGRGDRPRALLPADLSAAVAVERIAPYVFSSFPVLDTGRW